MCEKKTVSLSKEVSYVATQKAEKLYNGNFSSYITSLIIKDNKKALDEMTNECNEEKSQNIQTEEMKIERVSKDFPAKYTSGQCHICKKELIKGQSICIVGVSEGDKKLKAYSHTKCFDNK